MFKSFTNKNRNTTLVSIAHLTVVTVEVVTVESRINVLAA